MTDKDTPAARRNPWMGAAYAVLLLFTLLVGRVIADEVSGPAPAGGNVTKNPVLVGGYAAPSPLAVKDQGKLDYLSTDGRGALKVALPAASPLPVALPAASPVVVIGPFAHDASIADSGVVSTGGRSYTGGTLPPPVTNDNESAYFLTDLYGRARGYLEYASGVSVPGDATGLQVKGPLPAGSPVGTLASLPVTPVLGAPKLALAGTATGVADIIASTNVSNYQGWCLQLSGLSSSTVQVQGSNDNSTWVAIPGIVGTAASQSGITSSLTGNSFYTGPVPTAYLKVACTVYGSGTISANLTLTPAPPVMPGAIVGVAGTANQGATASGAPVRVGGVYQSSPTTLSDGQIGTPLLTTKGVLAASLVSNNNAAAISDGNGVYVQGGLAHDAPNAGSFPVRIAGRARDQGSPYSAVSADDVADLVTTLTGVLRSCIDADGRCTGADSKNVPQEAGGSTAVAVKASAGNLYSVTAYSPTSAVSYLQVYNTAQGSVTVGTTSPIYTACIGNSSMPFQVQFNPPILFSSAISYAVTTTANGSTAPASNVTLHIGYK